MGDWLGTGTIAYFKRQYQPFKKARAFARALGLKSVADWYSYCKSGANPDDIPKTPWHVYAADGWVGMKDWLGNAKAHEQPSVRPLRGTPRRNGPLGRTSLRLPDL
jgi:hypothetical protein